MLRATLSFFSILAFGVVSAAALVAMVPWIAGQNAEGAAASGLHFESLLLGLLLGLLLATVARYHWSDIPRRIVTWFLVRERQFFYYGLIGVCTAVLIFY
jgi:hypothetical protein